MTTNNAVDSSLSGTTGTGNFVGSNSPTLVTPALGTPSAINLSNATSLVASALPSGTMFNFLQGQLPTPVVITSNSTWTSVSGLSIAITPTSASNKVLVRAVFTASAGDANNIPMFRLYNTTAAIPLGVGGSVGSRTPASSCYYIAAANPNQIIPVTLEWLDSPATTSTTTYTVQVFAANVTTATTLSLGATATDTDNGFFPRTVSTISVCEIHA